MVWYSNRSALGAAKVDSRLYAASDSESLGPGQGGRCFLSAVPDAAALAGRPSRLWAFWPTRLDQIEK